MWAGSSGSAPGGSSNRRRRRNTRKEKASKAAVAAGATLTILPKSALPDSPLASPKSPRADTPSTPSPSPPAASTSTTTTSSEKQPHRSQTRSPASATKPTPAPPTSCNCKPASSSCSICTKSSSPSSSSASPSAAISSSSSLSLSSSSSSPAPSARKILEVHEGQLAWSDSRGPLQNQLNNIVSTIGFQGSGKSSLLNWLVHQLSSSSSSSSTRTALPSAQSSSPPPTVTGKKGTSGISSSTTPFEVASESDLRSGRAKTGGVWVSAADSGTLLIDTQPVFSPSCLDELLRNGHNYATHETHSLQIAVLLLSISNVLLVVQEGSPDLGLWNFLATASNLLQQITEQQQQQPAKQLPQPAPQPQPVVVTNEPKHKAAKPSRTSLLLSAAAASSSSSSTASGGQQQQPQPQPSKLPASKPSARQSRRACPVQLVLVFTKWPDSRFDDNPRKRIQEQATEFFANANFNLAPEIFMFPSAASATTSDFDFFRTCPYPIQAEQQRLLNLILQAQKTAAHRAQESLTTIQKTWAVIQHSVSEQDAD